MSCIVTLFKVSFKTCLRFLGLVVVNAIFDHGIAAVKNVIEINNYIDLTRANSEDLASILL